ncbi:hypothetical protein SAMN04488694_12613 [Natrinema hispanicum]|uniref:Uncharacterized protein n=1 Tax=Natrinema hispanicum TaxID=392421 RepID=A0A1I0IU41_9EURY|nr:hypothetical protein SAMN04488694_12613 [Natrinema hispanicum]
MLLIGCRISGNDVGLMVLAGLGQRRSTEHGRDHTTDRRRGYDGASSGTLTRDESSGNDPAGWYPC